MFELIYFDIKRLYFMEYREINNKREKTECGDLEPIWCIYMITWQAGSIKRKRGHATSAASNSEWLKKWKCIDGKNILRHIQEKKNHQNLEKRQRDISSRLGFWQTITYARWNQCLSESAICRISDKDLHLVTIEKNSKSVSNLAYLKPQVVCRIVIYVDCW